MVTMPWKSELTYINKFTKILFYRKNIFLTLDGSTVSTYKKFPKLYKNINNILLNTIYVYFDNNKYNFMVLFELTCMDCWWIIILKEVFNLEKTTCWENGTGINSTVNLNFYKAYQIYTNITELRTKWYVHGKILCTIQRHAFTSEEPTNEPRWTTEMNPGREMNMLYVTQAPTTNYDGLRISPTTLHYTF